MALSEFGQVYLENLRDLKTPDRRSIVTLKDLAFENPSEATAVVRAIRQHIKQCPGAHRLPALYLVDCMLKTDCPAVYAEQLSQALLEIFVYVWDNSDAATRPALTKLCKLWRSVACLDQKVVQACEAYMVPAGQTSAATVTGGTLPTPGFRGYPVTQPPPRPSGPFHRPPGPVAVGNGAVFAPRVLGQPVQQQQPQLSLQVQPVPFQGGHPPRPAFAPVHVPPTMIVQVPQYVPPQPVQQPQLAYTGAPQQRPPFTGFPTAAPVTIVQHSFPAVLPATLPNAPTIPPSSPQPAPHSPPQLQQPCARPRSTEFPGPRALQELDETAVQDLRNASDRTRPAFLDAEFLRNKRRAGQSASGHPSRQWYPSVDLWLVGTTAAADDNTDAKAEDESLEAETDKIYSVEEDPSQPDCAISGEPFERFYDPDSDKWCYKDAVILTGDEAAKYGVMDGSIVKVQCLPGAPTKLQMATLRAATAAASVADDLRQATAQASSGSSGAAAQPETSPTLLPPQQSAAPSHQVVPGRGHAPQPVFVKEEPGLGAPAGVIGTATTGNALKRPGDMGPGPGIAPPGFHEAKRVKLEVQ